MEKARRKFAVENFFLCGKWFGSAREWQREQVLLEVSILVLFYIYKKKLYLRCSKCKVFCQFPKSDFNNWDCDWNWECSFTVTRCFFAEWSFCIQSIFIFSSRDYLNTFIILVFYAKNLCPISLFNFFFF